MIEVEIWALGISILSFFFSFYRSYSLSKFKKRELVRILEKEFDDLLEHRLNAIKYLKEYKVKDHKVLSFYELYSELDIEEWSSISHVAHFFEKLYVYKNNKVIDIDYAKIAFENAFVGWGYSEHGFKEILQSELDREIDELNEFAPNWVIAFIELRKWLIADIQPERYYVNGSRKNEYSDILRQDKRPEPIN